MKTLFKKLAEAKKEIGKISKDSTNPFFKSKYFDINQLLEHTESILQSKGLMCLQPIKDGKVVTMIVEVESGESIESSIDLPNLTDPQKLGSAITYFRRYTLQSLLSLQAEDDDGNKAVQEDVIWLTEEQFNTTFASSKKDINNVLIHYNGKNGKNMKKEYRDKLNAKLKDL